MVESEDVGILRSVIGQSGASCSKGDAGCRNACLVGCRRWKGGGANSGLQESVSHA